MHFQGGSNVKLNYISRGTGLEEHGITNANIIYWTPPTPVLYEQIMQHREGLITHLGPIAVKRVIIPAALPTTNSSSMNRDVMTRFGGVR
jgi:hypothetical protein